MSTWRRRFSRRRQRSNENDEILVNNTMKYRKKLQAALIQIQRTKKFLQRNLESSESEIHVARLINDIGQLSDCKSLQEISGLIDSLAMRHQLSSRIFNEYSMNALEETLENLNDHLSKDFDQIKSVLEQAKSNRCSDQTQKKLSNQVQNEWKKHQKLALEEFKRGLGSYCQIGFQHVKIQMALLERLQNFVDQLPPVDRNDQNEEIDRSLPNFVANSLQTRREIDTMLRVMLDGVANDSACAPDAKRPKFLTNHLTLSNALYSPEVTEAARRSRQSSVLTERNVAAMVQTPEHHSTIISSPSANATALTNGDSLPSYTDLFVVPGSCKGNRLQSRS